MARPSDRGVSMKVGTTIRITQQDKECIRAAARAEGLNTSQFVRRVLAAYGVFPLEIK